MTALYDIGRVNADGRSIDTYLGWLNRTLRLPVPITLYLDPNIDISRVELTPQVTVIRLPWEELATAKWLPKVEEICRGRAKFRRSGDMSYILPKFIVTTMAKFDVLERTAAAHPDRPYVVWVDAGVSRQTPYDMSRLKPRMGFIRRLMSQCDFAFSAQRRLRDYLHGAPHEPFPGRCVRLMHGGVLLERADGAARVRDAIFDHVERNWLAHDLWDTEQTAVGEVFLARKFNAAIQNENGRWISLLGAMFEPSDPLPFAQAWDMRASFWKYPLPLRMWGLARLPLHAAWRNLRYGGNSLEVAEIVRTA